ncbi:enoyl-CoA hydratase/isomerase family protein [Streptomyces cellulosae]|uniref:Enoyl-CoA hydratase/isomerase family protein n=1 Tax=Streptomyces cellulosae TaxID=1968 RepID=A0ABW7YCC6_STRCE
MVPRSPHEGELTGHAAPDLHLPGKEDEATIAEIVLAHPPQNRLTTQLIDELGKAVADTERSEARAVLLRAEGPDFSFGGDFTAWRGMTARKLRATLDRYLDVYNRFDQLPVPVIAAVQGALLRWRLRTRAACRRGLRGAERTLRAPRADPGDHHSPRGDLPRRRTRRPRPRL